VILDGAKLQRSPERFRGEARLSILDVFLFGNAQDDKIRLRRLKWTLH